MNKPKVVAFALASMLGVIFTGCAQSDYPQQTNRTFTQAEKRAFLHYMERQGESHAMGNILPANVYSKDGVMLTISGNPIIREEAGCLNTDCKGLAMAALDRAVYSYFGSRDEKHIKNTSNERIGTEIRRIVNNLELGPVKNFKITDIKNFTLS